MSQLVDHYLLQLKSFLPAKQRDDIAAEIAESIRASADERERELGRALSDDETRAVLAGFGHPLLVAGRYLPRQYLIGPDVFALYWYVLQAVLSVVAVIGIALAVVNVFLNPHAGGSALGVLWDFVGLGIGAAAIVTLVFAMLDQPPVRPALLEALTARDMRLDLFGVRAASLAPIPRSETIREIALTTIFLLWWLGWLVFPNTWRDGIPITLSASVERFYSPVIVLCAVELARLAVDLMRPYRTKPRLALRVCVSAAWLALLSLAFLADDLLQAPGGAGDERIAAVLRLAEMSLHFALFAVGAAMALSIAIDLVRIARR